MTWLKLDDGILGNPKILAAGDLAAHLYIAGLCYCSAHLTDGEIPAGMVARLTGLPNPQRLADRLVEVGLWEPADTGYRVPDYLEHQQSRAQVLAERGKARQRAARRRQPAAEPVDSPEVRAKFGRSSGEVRAKFACSGAQEVRVPETETETETETELLDLVLNQDVSQASAALENDLRWRRAAATFEGRGEPAANTYRVIARLLAEGISPHVIDEAAGWCATKPDAGLGLFTTVARAWQTQRTGTR